MRDLATWGYIAYTVFAFTHPVSESEVGDGISVLLHLATTDRYAIAQCTAGFQDLIPADV